jgi:hypothetical protein
VGLQTQLPLPVGAAKGHCDFGVAGTVGSVHHGIGGFADDPLLLCLGIKFAMDSLLEGAGFELVWGFFCQVVVFGFFRFFVRSWKPFFVPSPAIRFAERAEGVKGPKR